MRAGVIANDQPPESFFAAVSIRAIMLRNRPSVKISNEPCWCRRSEAGKSSGKKPKVVRRSADRGSNQWAGSLGREQVDDYHVSRRGAFCLRRRAAGV